jgi:hypothetical protein
MGAIVIRNIVFIILISFTFVSCSVLQNGYTNEYGQYVPKIPRFKLKDKQGVFPELLDTTNIYRMIEMYNDGNLVYPNILAPKFIELGYNYHLSTRAPTPSVARGHALMKIKNNKLHEL